MATQRTLEGETTDASRERPDTFRNCLHCRQWVLRSQWSGHCENPQDVAVVLENDDRGTEKDDE